MRTRRGLLACTLVLGWSLAAPDRARAESSLRLESPDAFGSVPAATYDESGERVGDANLVVERLDDGRVRIVSEVESEAHARQVATALLERVPDSQALRPVSQESRTFLSDGSPVGILAIDHVARLGSCSEPNGDGKMQLRTVKLPAGDRVVNVPFNLFFAPLARGEKEQLEFQIFLCRDGPRLLDFNAFRREGGASDRSKLVEVRYEPDFGIVSLIARNFVPQLSFWFDRSRPHEWMAHRMPLYSRGPEVVIVRDGVPFERVSNGN